MEERHTILKLQASRRTGVRLGRSHESHKKEVALFWEGATTGEKRDRERTPFFRFNLQKTEKRKTFVLSLVRTSLSSFAWLYLFCFVSSQSSSCLVAGHPKTTACFVFCFRQYHCIFPTHTDMHTNTLLGHRRQMPEGSDDEPSATSCAYFPLVTLEVAFFICYSSSSPPTVCYIDVHSARDKDCSMSPLPLTNMPKGTLVKTKASLQTTILSFFLIRWDSFHEQDERLEKTKQKRERKRQIQKG